ncbi:MAG: fused MFS/spermidine synthase [Chloroflexi bacterium]|nr:fused MFS/spermidine synthase [Chloroflexota bacterium]
MTHASPRIDRFSLYVTVFASGLVTLAIELSAARLLGSVFGTSNLIWANIIGLILLYLTAGYFIGGRWADRSPYPATLFRILLWASFLCAIIPLVSRPVLQAAAQAVVAAQAGTAIGSFVVTLALFSVPITLLGCVSPFAIRLAVTDPNDAGRVSGTIYAVSTLGSLIGTFLPTLVLLGSIGTTATFLVLSGGLWMTAFVMLLRITGRRALRWLWMPLPVIALLLLVTGPLRAAPEGFTLLDERESAYNYIQVLENPAGYRSLALNEGQGVHSIYHPTILRYNGTWDFFLTAPFFVPGTQPSDVQSLAVVGLAAGTIPRQYQHAFGDIRMVGFEIDPEIIAVGEAYFGMSADDLPTLESIAEDGRPGLNAQPGTYDVIALDAYRPPYIPWQLTTVEFFREIRSKLTDRGVVALNVGRTSTDRRLVDAFSNVLAQVFPSVHAIDVPRSFNTILYATVMPTTEADLRANVASLPAEAPGLLRDVLDASLGALVPVTPSDVVFTDDRAPVEALFDSLVLNFLLSDDMDDLR